MVSVLLPTWQICDLKILKLFVRWENITQDNKCKMIMLMLHAKFLLLLNLHHCTSLSNRKPCHFPQNRFVYNFHLSVMCNAVDIGLKCWWRFAIVYLFWEHFTTSVVLTTNIIATKMAHVTAVFICRWFNIVWIWHVNLIILNIIIIPIRILVINYGLLVSLCR